MLLLTSAEKKLAFKESSEWFFTPAEVCYNFHCNRTSLTLYSKRKTITAARKESLHHLRGISNISTQYVPPLPFTFHLHVIVSPPSWASAGSAGGAFPLKGTFFLPTVDKCFSWGGERLLYNTCWWELPLFNSTELTGWGMNLQRLVNIMDTESILGFLAHL